MRAVTDILADIKKLEAVSKATLRQLNEYSIQLLKLEEEFKEALNDEKLGG